MISTGEIETHVVDLFFRVQGKELDVDHGYAVYAAISRILEHEEDRWLHAADHVGIHPLRGRYLGQGRLLLNPRAQLGLRLPVNLISRALKLAGKRLEVNGDSLWVGTSTATALIPASVLYAHIVTTKHGDNEYRFDSEIQWQLHKLNIKSKPIRGPRRILTIKDKKVVGYSLLVSELTAEESIQLQEHGLGGRRKMGCGVFVAHKDGR